MFHSQFLRYQVDDLSKCVVEAERIDVSWRALSLVKDQVTGLPKYTLLANVVKWILTMYHSNADCERLFSIVRKNKTDFHVSMSTPVLGALLTHKRTMSAKSQLCYSVQHSTETLKKAKSATYNKLTFYYHDHKIISYWQT